MSVDSLKRPLMMAALNGLYVARMPVPESPSEDGAKAATDERVQIDTKTYFNYQLCAFPCKLISILLLICRIMELQTLGVNLIDFM